MIDISLRVDPSLTEFTVELFDGEMGGTWDRWSDPHGNFDSPTFHLYKDPDVNAQPEGDDLLHSWAADDMLDDEFGGLPVVNRLDECITWVPSGTIQDLRR